MNCNREREKGVQFKLKMIVLKTLNIIYNNSLHIYAKAKIIMVSNF